MRNKGYIHLYTGNGKGKTTAAIGLAIRAVGAGKRVFIGQFVKGMPYAELDALIRFPEIEIKQFGLDCFIKNKPTQNDIEAAREGLSEIKFVIKKNLYHLVILDEICIALYYNLFEVDDVLALLKSKPSTMEIVLTGRYATQELIDAADLVTEMKVIKHYYNIGVDARKGIEY
ncbi:MAG: cob(I)yrinic acid a,c-diamide adenosyltransferase [Tenuifilaceae bacterium]|jgi:cob(I)alamin adenosyltransferase|nr:cob(I)yrinic acid a,c-diamide adenosyltransferase [Tenuifilaceae bacterium]